MTRALTMVLAILVTAACCAPLPAFAQDATQRVAGKQLEGLAKRAMGGIAAPGDSAFVQAAPVRDQIVPYSTFLPCRSQRSSRSA